MSSFTWITYALIGVSCAQAAIAFFLDRAEPVHALFYKIVSDGTKKHDMDGITQFFHREDVSELRLEHIARIAALAASATAQFCALIGTSAACMVLFILALASPDRETAWTIVTGCVAVVPIYAAISLANRARKGRLRDHMLKRPSRREIANTPIPYFSVVAAGSVWVAVVGSIFD